MCPPKRCKPSPLTPRRNILKKPPASKKNDKYADSELLWAALDARSAGLSDLLLPPGALDFRFQGNSFISRGLPRSHEAVPGVPCSASFQIRSAVGIFLPRTTTNSCLHRVRISVNRSVGTKTTRANRSTSVWGTMIRPE